MAILCQKKTDRNLQLDEPAWRNDLAKSWWSSLGRIVLLPRASNVVRSELVCVTWPAGRGMKAAPWGNPR